LGINYKRIDGGVIPLSEIQYSITS
jgi:hypothetical protein